MVSLGSVFEVIVGQVLTILDLPSWYKTSTYRSSDCMKAQRNVGLHA